MDSRSVIMEKVAWGLGIGYKGDICVSRYAIGIGRRP